VAPVIGLLADVYGVGMALAVVGVVFIAVLPAVRVRRVTAL